MIDSTNTTVEWQTHTSDILVLPVGAFEQHSVHLPLDTDCIQANYFGRFIAEEFDAALLPCLSIATSMEHTGFRGSFSLRPETLMQVIRDVAADAARQNFRILIVANAHGGNHCLVPVCRDINRQDGPLKILLVNFWEHRDTAIGDTQSRPGCNFHAEEMETSILLAIAPELVRSDRSDADYPDGPHPFVQADLTTFGVGQVSPSGAVGWPSEASVEKGKALVASIRKGLAAHLRNRISRLRERPRYAGSGGLAIRPLRPEDIPDAMQLCRDAGWNQTDRDWAMLIAANPAGSFAMVHHGRVVGTTIATRYGTTLAWIGMVLVAPAFRGMGIATQLMQQALASVTPTQAVQLDATALGLGVYEKLGFAACGTVTRMICRHAPAPLACPTAIETITDATMETLLETDAAVFGANRSDILRALRHASPNRCLRIVDREGRQGYVLGRDGMNAYHICPVIAADAALALTLVTAILSQLKGAPALIDVPEGQAAFYEGLLALGFVPERCFTRMLKGSAVTRQHGETVFAIGGPEIG
ncbi:MAG: GNAT family N-acetyltransferase [Verrucomicrobia bacterium]|nr:GNAT family N-acetyltransferase [Verrucomicrobiota bacterium]